MLYPVDCEDVRRIIRGLIDRFQQGGRIRHRRIHKKTRRSDHACRARRRFLCGFVSFFFHQVPPFRLSEDRAAISDRYLP